MHATTRFSTAAMEGACRPISDQHLRRLVRAIAGPVAVNGSETRQTADFRHFDWNVTGRSRTWWWTVQQLPTLAWSYGDLSKLPAHQAEAVIELNGSVLGSWAAACRSQESTSPLAWHDHASALRAINLFRWLCTLVAAGREDWQTEALDALVAEHVRWLVEDRNYSRGTNHGFEQAWILLEIAMDSCGRYGNLDLASLAKERLVREIRGSFSGQGVHKENSPGYHFFMIQRLRQLREFLERRGAELDQIALDALVDDADRFLASIALPDCSLPLIGDTQAKPQHAKYVSRLLRMIRSKDSEQVSDYTKSGYLIWRSKGNRRSPDVHMVFKNAHESSYHRHDDDLSIHLAISGKVVFGDSGLYTYDSNDAVREFVRSAHAHSTVFPVDLPKPPRRPKLLLRRPATKFHARHKAVSGTTYAYDGLAISRRCKLVGRSGRIIKVTDTVVNRRGTNVEMLTAFIVPIEFQCRDEGPGHPVVSISDGSSVNLRLQVQSGPVARLGIVEGWHDCPERCSVRSVTMGTFVPARKILVSWVAATGATTSLVLVLDLQSPGACPGTRPGNFDQSSTA